MKQMCKKKFQSPFVCCRASFTDCSKATRVRKFYMANTGVVETNNIEKILEPWQTT